MGKVKKGKKISKDDDIEEDYELESTATKNNSIKTKNEDDENHDNDNSDENEDLTKKKKNKKDKKKKKVEEDEEKEEIPKNLKETSKKDKKKKKVSKSKSNSSTNLEESDSEESSRPPQSSKSTRGRSGFALIAPESDDDDDDDQPVENDSSDHEEIPKPAPVTKGKEKKSKKKKNRHASDDEDDLDKMLAELRLEYEGKNPQEETNKESTNENKHDSKKSTKNKNEQIKNENIEKDDLNKDNNEIAETVGTVKTAAQKKKEKKEKQKKLAQSKKVEEASLEKQPSIEKNNAQDDEKKSEITSENPPKVTEGEGESNIPGDDKKKKKKKGGKEEAEKDDKKGVKGPGKKTIAAMQDALKKLKEDEEKLAREEEERIRKIEEAERAKEEQARLEKERKEKRKQKEKERKDRLKAEGKLLTAKQKADRARAQAMLENLKAQGLVELPTERRPPASRARPGKKTKKDQQQQQPSEQKEQPESEPQTQQEEVETQQIQLEIVEASPETSKESDDDVKDAWDAESSPEDGEDAHEDKPKHGKREVARTNEKTSTSNIEAECDSDEETEDSDSESEESDSSEETIEDKKSDAERRRERALKRIQKRREEAEKARTPDDLRAAVVCVLGHVDTGKTKILDKLRGTNVQDGEAGGITQQIGATNVPVEAIQEQAKHVKDFKDTTIRLPGLLIIDTPGHESFSNLRSRGSSLCDIAILVVDIMHGLEPQTIESIELLKSRKTPFIIALNKIDRLYEWQTMPRRDIRDILKAQAPHTQLEFDQRTKHVIVQFAEQGLNATLFYENQDPRKYLSLVPTSAITGEGMGNLLALLVDSCQNMLTKRLMYSEELQATVLEVKAIPGLGTTIFAILVNGRLREGDTVVIAGTDGPIVTQIRSLIMPQPLRELRVKSAYVEYKEIRAAQGVKIAAKELDKAIAGLNLLVAQHPDEVDILRDEVKKELRSALSHIKLSERGVYVQASTLGSLEALLVYLESEKIPYSNVRIGPVAKRDVTKASAMLEHDNQYATILAFNVKVEREAQDLANTLGVRIFQAEIIYHLFDSFQKYRDELLARRREQFKNIAVFPCKLRVMPQFIFNSRDPIVVGVMVEAGIVREGTPICVPTREFVELGIVTSIESNHKSVETARKGLEVCIKIEPIPGEAPKMFGRHFDEKDLLVSKITRQSIDACKDHFRDDLLKTDWQLMVELKKTFQIL